MNELIKKLKAKKNDQAKAQFTGYVDQELYLNFIEKIEGHCLKKNDVLTSLMELFIETDLKDLK